MSNRCYLVQFKQYNSGIYQQWETITIVNSYFAVVTPDTSDLINGVWTFNTQPFWPLYATGVLHDEYGASADLFEQLRAKWKTESFSISAGPTKLALEQRSAEIANLIADLRRKARGYSTGSGKGRVVKTRRTDLF